VFEENWRVYGVRKIWRQLRREGFDVARCTVARLMKVMGIQGIIRGKPHRTTIPDEKAPCPPDKVNRQFRVPAPNMLWVSDFTYVATWKGFVFVAFVIDAYARRIVGWRVSTSPHAGFVLDALEQAVHERRPTKGMGLVHHSDRGSQYLSIKYTERLAEAGIEPSVGSVGDSYDNALAETINGLFKAEVIHRRGPWRSFEAVEYATLEWVDWFNNRRLLEPIGNIPPAEGRCCTTMILADSHCESMRLDRPHEQAITRPLPHDELVQLHCCASQARVFADLAGQGDDLARAA
jgi:putative transposase